MTTQHPEALHHTKYLTAVYRDINPGDEARELITHPKMTAASWSHVMDERDRLRSENETLQAGCDAARLEIESLQARIKTMAEEHADELMVAHVDGRMRAAHGQAPARADMQDAYVGAREDLAIWKRRALEAERDLRAERETASRLAAEINAINGPTHLGEPAPTAHQPVSGTA